ncbi:MAG: hypothetical protein AB1420_17560 [Bacillota bacterium]
MKYLRFVGFTLLLLTILIFMGIKADLTIELLKCDERSFIKKPTRISTYINQEFEYIVDSAHLRQKLGAGIA